MTRVVHLKREAGLKLKIRMKHIHATLITHVCKPNTHTLQACMHAKHARYARKLLTHATYATLCMPSVACVRGVPGIRACVACVRTYV